MSDSMDRWTESAGLPNGGAVDASTPVQQGLVSAALPTSGALLVVLHAEGGSPLDVPKPFSQPICLVPDTRVAGTTHVDGIEELAEPLHEGDRLRLERDAANRYDEWCIRVLDEWNRRLGFVSADINEIPARLMDGGKRLYAEVTSVELRDGWVRIGIGVWLDD